MVKKLRNKQGSMTIELVTALVIIVTVVIPLGLSFVDEQHMCRVYYWRAVAMEVVDGEMEVLAAGEWQALPQGAHPYTVHAESANHLPDGQFLLTVEGKRLRLSWQPKNPKFGGPVVREAVGR